MNNQDPFIIVKNYRQKVQEINEASLLAMFQNDQQPVAPKRRALQVLDPNTLTMNQNQARNTKAPCLFKKSISNYQEKDKENHIWEEFKINDDIKKSHKFGVQALPNPHQANLINYEDYQQAQFDQQNSDIIAIMPF